MYQYFIVFFAKKGTNGEISAWGLCDVEISKDKSKRVKKKYEGDPFLDIDHGFPGNPAYNYKRVFHYKKIYLFKERHNCREFRLIKNEKQIEDLRLLRNIIYVEMPFEIFNEIEEKLKE